MKSYAVRMLAMLTLGIALGLVAGARLFGPTGSETIQSASEPGAPSFSQRGVSGSQAAPFRSSFPRRAQRDATVAGTPAAGARPTLVVSMETLARIPVSAFAPRRGSPWTQPESRFELTAEVRDLLGIDDGSAEEVRNALERAHDEYMKSGWQSPAHIETTEKGVAISVAPSPAEARERIHQDLRAVLGDQSADLLMQFSGETLDWEFGGFGRLERVLEVTLLPDESLSIRESLRPLRDANNGAAPVVERRVNQYRIENLPSELARFVELGDSP